LTYLSGLIALPYFADVDTITTDVNSPNPAIFFQQSFPFFGNEFFNSFGGFGFGATQEPWWKG